MDERILWECLIFSILCLAFLVCLFNPTVAIALIENGTTILWVLCGLCGVMAGLGFLPSISKENPYLADFMVSKGFLGFFLCGAGALIIDKLLNVL